MASLLRALTDYGSVLRVRITAMAWRNKAIRFPITAPSYGAVIRQWPPLEGAMQSGQTGIGAQRMFRARVGGFKGVDYFYIIVCKRSMIASGRAALCFFPSGRDSRSSDMSLLPQDCKHTQAVPLQHS